MFYTHLQSFRRFLFRDRFRHVQTRLIVCFSIAFTLIITGMELVSLFGLPFSSYHGTVGQRRIEACRVLSVIADTKEQQLRSWINERQCDLAMLANRLNHRKTVAMACRTARQAIAAGLPAEEVVRRMREDVSGRTLMGQLREVIAVSADCRHIRIADTETGRVVASDQECEIGEDYRKRPCLSEVVRLQDDYVEDVHAAPDGGDLVLGMSRPILNVQNRWQAAVIIEFQVGTVLRLVVRADEGLGEQGEVVLINRDRKSLTDLKFLSLDGSKVQPLEDAISTEISELVANGETGFLECRDYRGVDVLAAYRYIQITYGVGWGLVVKETAADVYGAIRDDFLTVLATGLVGVVAVVVLTILVSRALARPIRELERVASLVAKGDLTEHAAITTKDEIGSLGGVFNGMIEEIRRDRETILRQERFAAFGQLTATVSHELRNPLSTIRSSFFLLGEWLRGADPAIGPILGRIERSIERCDAIIADLLDFGRMRDLDLKSTDVDAWLEVLLNEYNFPNGVTLRRNLVSNVRLPIDRERLRRCVVNLLSNACQAMGPNGGQLTVSSRSEDQRWVASVGDTGSGIPGEQLERVFEPLFSTKPLGVGLGLPIVRQIVQQHGGDVSIASTVGEATVVSFWLPLLTEEGKGAPSVPDRESLHPFGASRRVGGRRSSLS